MMYSLDEQQYRTIYFMANLVVNRPQKPASKCMAGRDAQKLRNCAANSCLSARRWAFFEGPWRPDPPGRRMRASAKKFRGLRFFSFRFMNNRDQAGSARRPGTRYRG